MVIILKSLRWKTNTSGSGLSQNEDYNLEWCPFDHYGSPTWPQSHKR